MANSLSDRAAGPKRPADYLLKVQSITIPSENLPFMAVLELI
jgi:hypothetical protein